MVLVTGATGLVGVHLLLKLVEKPLKVRAIYRSEIKKEAVKSFFIKTYGDTLKYNSIEWIKTDILDIIELEYAFKDVKKVFHVAGYISFDATDTKKLYQINVTGTANIVNLALKYKVEKLCYVSSIATLSQKANEEEIDEESSFNLEINNPPYYISKYLGEIEIWKAMQEGLNSVIINPGVILGPVYWNSQSTRILKIIKKQKPLFFLPGNVGLVNVWDVVDIMIKLMDSKISKNRYIIVAQNISFREFQNIVADTLSISRPKFRIPLLVLKTVCYWYSFTKLFTGKQPISIPIVKKMYQNHIYNNQKIKDTIGYQFTPIKDSIRKMLQQ